MVQQLKGKTFYTETIHSNTNLIVKAKYVYLNTNNLYINSIPLYELLANVASNKSFIFSHSSQSQFKKNVNSKKLLFRNITTKPNSNILTLSAENEIIFDTDHVFLNEHKFKDYISKLLDIPMRLHMNNKKKKDLMQLLNEFIMNHDELDIQSDSIQLLLNRATDDEIEHLDNKSKTCKEDIIILETLSDIIHDVSIDIKIDKKLNKKEQYNIRKDLINLDVDNKNMKFELDMLETQVYKPQDQEDCDHNKLGSYFVNEIVADKIEPLDCHDIVEITNETGINLCISSLKDVNDVLKKLRFGN